MNKSINIVSLKAPGKIEIQNSKLDDIQPEELYCSTVVTAISTGTELAAYRGLPVLRPSVKYPRLVGYCNVAKVVEVGSLVSDVKPGDKILTYQSHRSGFIINKDEIIYKLSSDDDPDLTSTSYLFHLGYNATLRSRLCLGSKVVVIGLGVLGLTSVATASMGGARVLGVSNQEVPSNIALQYGAEEVYSRKQENLILNHLGKGLSDVVILTTNSWSDWEFALKFAGKFSTIAVMGFPGRGELSPKNNPLDSQYFYVKQLKIEAVGESPEKLDPRGFCRFNELENIKFITSKIRDKTINPQPLISGYFKGVEIKKAYDALLERKDSSITYLLKWE